MYLKLEIAGPATIYLKVCFSLAILILIHNIGGVVLSLECNFFYFKNTKEGALANSTCKKCLIPQIKYKTDCQDVFGLVCIKTFKRLLVNENTSKNEFWQNKMYIYIYIYMCFWVFLFC